MIARDLGLHEQLHPIVVGSGHRIDAGHALDAAGETVGHEAVDIVDATIWTDQWTSRGSTYLMKDTRDSRLKLTPNPLGRNPDCFLRHTPYSLRFEGPRYVL